MAGVSEQAAVFGPRKSLVGIVAHDASRAAADLPAVVILNAGIIHRIGPNRMFVNLARTLASRGHVVVRFDLSGIGDSEPRGDALPPLQAAMADIGEVIDSLAQTRKVKRVILIGLCSGADQAIVYCGHDPRVTGVILIDPSVPRTRRYYVRHYRGRMFRLQSWINFASGRHAVWNVFKPSARMPDTGSSANDLQSPQVRAFLERAYRGAVEGGVNLMAIFTAGRESQHNYPEQLPEAFPRVPFGERLHLEYFGRTDHTFTFDDDREALTRCIVDWTKRYAPNREAPAAYAGDEVVRARAP
jgi:pimeloyl-ACP methyl ester carboxylesterase